MKTPKDRQPIRKTAWSEFELAASAIRNEISQIEQGLEKYYTRVGDEADWADVGNLKHVAALLKAVRQNVPK